MLDVTRDAATLRLPSLAHMLAETVRRFPGRPAVSNGQSVLTYGAMAEKAAMLARGFPTDGGKFCALFGGRSQTIYAGVVAALRGDRTYLPLGGEDPLERLLQIARQTDFDLLIADAEVTPRLPELLAAIDWSVTVILGDSVEAPAWCRQLPQHRFLAWTDLLRLPPATLDRGTNPDAYLLFTSGSTGNPKGVLVGHDNVLAYVANILALYGPDETDRFSHLAPLGFDFSVHEIFVPWRVGACVCVFEPGNGYSLARYITDNALTFWASVPSTAVFLDRLRQLTPAAFPSLKVAVFCGEALKEATARAWSKAAPNCRLDNIYGPTETTVAVTTYPWRPAPEGNGIVPIGWAFDGVLLRVVDAGGNDVAGDEAGELWIGGAQVARGYWRNPEQDAARFVSHAGQRWYRTGDLVRRAEDVGLRFLGRMDDQMQIQGYRVERLEAEALLQIASGCADVAVMAWPPGERHTVESLVFFVAEFEEGPVELRRVCQRAMSRAMLPSRVYIGPIPKNRNGKTDYGALQARLVQESKPPVAKPVPEAAAIEAIALPRGVRVDHAVTYVAPQSVDISLDPAALGITPFRAKIYGSVFGFRSVPVAEPGGFDALLASAVRDAVASLPDPKCLKVALHAHTGPMVGVFGTSSLRRALRAAGAGNAVAFGLCSNRCVSIFNAIEASRRWLGRESPGAKALVVTGETAFTQEIRVIENVALAGDAAGAMVISLDGPGDRMLASHVRTEGRFARGVWLGQDGRSDYERNYHDMMADTISLVLERGKTSLDQVAWLLPHNINVKSWMFLAERMGFPVERIIRSNVPRTGHCFGTDMMLNLVSMRADGHSAPGDRYLMAAAGLGGTFAAALFECQ